MTPRYKTKGGDLIMVVCHLMTGICSGGCGRQFVIQISECTYTNLDSCDITRQYNLTKWLSYIQAAIEQNVAFLESEFACNANLKHNHSRNSRFSNFVFKEA